MKKMKILFPILSVASVATIAMSSITACNNKKAEDYGFKAIPFEKLNIELGDLNGLKDPTTKLTDYNKLTIPSTVEKVTGFLYAQEPKPTLAYESIQKVDFENRNNRCDIDVNCFASLPNLKTIEFPADCTKITLNEDSFKGCKKISIIDFSKSGADFNSTFFYFVWISGMATQGTFYANENNKTRVEIIRQNLGLSSTWSVEIKK